jgi:hypothetical protein
MKTKVKSKVKNLLTGKVLTITQLSKLIDTSEYNRLLSGEIVHKWEHAKNGLTEIKLSAI